MNRTKVARAAVTPIERRALELVAQADGLKISEVLRSLIRREAKERGLWASAMDTGEGQNGQAFTHSP